MIPLHEYRAAFIRTRAETESCRQLRILIDEKVNDEGGHGYRVVERLVELGFSKKELMVLKFAESDIDRAMQEGKENV